MSTAIRILHLKDDPADAELVRAALESEKMASGLTLTTTREEFTAALDGGCPDIILADYKLPSFDGLTALKIAREKYPLVPFILVSGTIGEERAVESLKAGVTDYIVKDRLSRLGTAVRRAIEEAEGRSERIRAAVALKHEAEVSSALLKAAGITSACLDWSEVVDKVVPLVNGLTGGRSTGLLMLDEDGLMHGQCAAGLPDDRLSLFYALQIKAGDIPAARWILENRKTLVSPAPELSEYIPGNYIEAFDLGDVMVAPILAREKVAGFLLANFDRLPDDPRVVEIFNGIAGQLGVSCENALLYENVQNKGLELARKVEVLKVLSEIDILILSSLKRDEMLSGVVSNIRRVLPADIGGVGLLDLEACTLRYSYGWGHETGTHKVVPLSGCSGAATLTTGEPLLRINLRDEPVLSEMDREHIDAGVSSDMYVPIINKGRGVGILYLGSYRVAGFTLEDEHTAARLANQLGIALENARLFSDLEDLVLGVVTALASAIDAKSPWTKGHSERVTEYAVDIAREMGMPVQEIEKLRLAGLLHDIGKIGTFDVILDKPGRLTDEEFELVKKHPDRGCEILSHINQFSDIIPIIRHHHERWDGSGYPSGLKGQEIPLMARILCVADSFDSMTADRPYRPSPGIEYAVEEFRRCSGTQFDKDVVTVFLKMIENKHQSAA